MYLINICFTTLELSYEPQHICFHIFIDEILHSLHVIKQYRDIYLRVSIFTQKESRVHIYNFRRSAVDSNAIESERK
jgi:hypothetical protein